MSHAPVKRTTHLGVLFQAGRSACAYGCSLPVVCPAVGRRNAIYWSADPTLAEIAATIVVSTSHANALGAYCTAPDAPLFRSVFV